MRVKSTLVALGAAAAAVFVPTANAQAATLPPDPWLHCAANAPYQPQVQDLGWQVIPKGVSGTTGQNNWTYDYLVAMVIPYGIEGEGYTLPPFTQSFPIDWALMCAQQFPGSHLQWVRGPMTGVLGAPWQCV